MALTTKPYKGARDFYPEDKRLQKFVFNTWRQAVERYGYEEYDAPIIEPLEIYLAKTGSEIVDEQTYAFTDRGKREVVIRPEMTPSVSRMVAAKRQELAYPLRLFSIPNLWRYERPQRGRLREHWQLNVDIFGVASENAELELIGLADHIFKSFGADQSMYEIRINHRGLVNEILMNYLDLDNQSAHQVGKLIDRKSKMDQSDFLSQLDEILSAKNKAAKAPEKLLDILNARKPTDLPSEVKSNEYYQQLVKLLEGLDLPNVVYSPEVMRGFDYYTGIVFEVFDTDPENNRAMMGGGRYDGLVGLFGVEPVPTVGFGWGDVTLVNFLDAHSLAPKLKPETDVYVCLIGDIYSSAQARINELRQQGINVAVDLS
ncbi:MAG TPA: histidine--tRNA ligase, partial [Candidatus Saccharimonadales bacterium]|nr:histidine--tRNA ligase [Candidatus Saccharimonadales bacterium]